MAESCGAAITAPANIGGGILSDRLKRPLLVIAVSLGAMTLPLAVLGEVSSIQRVNTRGGSAPASTCASAGKVLRVPYTADYRFFKVLDRSQP